MRRGEGDTERMEYAIAYYSISGIIMYKDKAGKKEIVGSFKTRSTDEQTKT